MNKEYKCRRCEYVFCSDDESPSCPYCDCYGLFLLKEQIVLDNGTKMVIEEHHIHPKFMDNPEGLGQKYGIGQREHRILHNMIMNWIWESIRQEDKEKIIEDVISKSKEFIGVENDTKAT
jgi:hypothetical protein